MIEKEASIGIYIPSYKRADTILTHNTVEYYKVVVRQSEYDDYLRTIPAENLIAVEDEKINSVPRVWNWCIDNAKEDIVVMIGDDCPDFIYRLDTNTKIKDKETITAEIERIGQLMLDLDIGWGCDDPTVVPWGYDGEFAFKGLSGGINWINKKVFKSRFNEDVGYCCDTDVVLQELLVNRIVLKPRYFCAGEPKEGSADKNKGGNSKKSRASMIASYELMKSKWGKYFDYDLKSNKIFVRVDR
ncbi:MAG TPA: hypothetical protein DHV37_06055 [Erysipelotrichaceae bacterium]|nr:hypothetical protein [Erysipelotrichaceae bacterium]